MCIEINVPAVQLLNINNHRLSESHFECFNYEQIRIDFHILSVRDVNFYRMREEVTICDIIVEILSI